MRRFAFALLLMFFCGSAAAERNDLAEYKGDLTLSFHGLPQFADFPAEAAPHHRAKDVDFKGNKRAWQYRTTLRSALAGEADFNGHYAVAIAGCGTGCQLNWIIDLESGKIIWHGQTEMGVAYRADSSLFIPNLYETDLDMTGGPYFNAADIRFLSVKAGKAYRIAEITGGFERHDAPVACKTVECR
ncbi:MAG: hypothetical protein PSY14_00980 [bacterium]|nr:hypothetical protein [bacterium]